MTSSSIYVRIQKNSEEMRTYWVVSCITVPESCRENWVDKLIHVLERVEIRVDPWGFRGSDLFDDKPNELLAET
jgi:hypothetical protein